MISSRLAHRDREGRAAVGQLLGIKYLRASQDASGRSISVSSQRDEGDEFFEENGILDCGEFCDNNLSASTYATEVRGDYERALEELRAGRANLLWTFDPSRAQRDLEVYVRLRRICIETRSFWAYGGRIYDMTDPADRKATGRDALEAEGASDVISGHVKRGKRKRKRARQGKYAGPRPYGYTRRFDPVTGESLGQVIAWEEAKIVRWCLDAKPLSWIARTLNDMGVPCPRDRHWDARLIRRLVAEHQHEHEWARLLARLSPEDAAVAKAPVLRVADGETPKELARELNRGAKQGKWDSHHVTNRAGRLIPFLACIGSLALGFVILVVGNAPYEMIALAAAELACLFAALAITFGLKFKVSMHAAVATGAVIILMITYSPVLLVLGLLVIWVCWSRVELRDHTASQVIVGAVVGAILGGLGYALLLAALG